MAQADRNAELERILSVHPKIWQNISTWGKETSKLNKYHCEMAFTIGNRLRRLNKKLTPIEMASAQKILDTAIQNSPELFIDMDELNSEQMEKENIKLDITIETIQKIIKWDIQNNVLKGYEFMFLKSWWRGRNLFQKKICLSRC